MLTDALLRTAVATGILAPSVHNTQPWLFHRDGDTVVVRADPTRWLHAEDPLGRELLISCGGAVRHLVLGLRSLGLDVSWEIAPDPADTLLVAVVTVVGHRPATLVDTELRAAAGLRHTDRSRFHPDQVAPKVIDRLRRLAELEGCFLADLREHEKLVLAVVTEHADRLINLDPALRAEQQSWVSTAEVAHDGLPQAALPEHGEGRGSPVTLRDFAAPHLTHHGSEPPVAERPTLLILGTDTDTAADWVACGWTLSDLLLTLTAEGLVCSPLTQALEIPGFREQLRAALALQGHPQMALRIGYPAGAGSPQSARRAVEDVLT